ncbi:MAG: hypothetical protein HC767_07025 [Akkermansiaceae bacterium]|nr:hypothetical protein [Akkermansiaceae bacterium]
MAYLNRDDQISNRVGASSKLEQQFHRGDCLKSSSLISVIIDGETVSLFTLVSRKIQVAESAGLSLARCDLAIISSFSASPY